MSKVFISKNNTITKKKNIRANINMKNLLLHKIYQSNRNSQSKYQIHIITLYNGIKVSIYIYIYLREF